MKKIIFYIMTTWLSLVFMSLQLHAQSDNSVLTSSSVVTKPKPVVTSENIAKIKVMESRINEINAMDKSNLTFAEKRILRKEVRSIKHQLQTIGGGVYISTGVIIIIIILLIIFL